MVTHILIDPLLRARVIGAEQVKWSPSPSSVIRNQKRVAMKPNLSQANTYNRSR